MTLTGIMTRIGLQVFQTVRMIEPIPFGQTSLSCLYQDMMLEIIPKIALYSSDYERIMSFYFHLSTLC